MDTHLRLVEDSSPDKSAEIALIKKAQARDKLAFKALYELHLSRVYGLCWRLCADKSLAEDATQEVFIQVWKKIDNFNGDSQFSTWLHSVASNVTISYLRRQKSWWQKMVGLEQSDHENQAAESSLSDGELDKWIMRLPERARWVFVLHAIEGYRHEQIAQTLNMAVGTSKAQFHRAKQLIEEWMDE